MKRATNALEWSIANGRQLALKVSCNSVYGFTGAEAGGVLPCKPIASSVTKIGRGMIEDSQQFAENVLNYPELNPYPFKLRSQEDTIIQMPYKAEVIYGDTVKKIFMYIGYFLLILFFRIQSIQNLSVSN